MKQFSNKTFLFAILILAGLIPLAAFLIKPYFAPKTTPRASKTPWAQTVIFPKAVLQTRLPAKVETTSDPQAVQAQLPAVVEATSGSHPKGAGPTFKSSDTPTFALNLNQSLKKFSFLQIFQVKAQEKISNEWKEDDFQLKANLTRIGEVEKNVQVEIDKQSNDSFNLIIQKTNPQAFTPGQYKLEVELSNKDGKNSFAQDFAWGVLVVNTDKTVYTPGEKVNLQMAALDKSGHTICDADLKLAVTDPVGKTTTPEIKKSTTCGADNVTDNPDYSAFYQLGSTDQKTVGIYHIKLTNNNNQYSVDDSFEAKESVPFVVERIGATRINPFKSEYTMNIKVTANQDFEGQVIEAVPSDFKIENSRNGKQDLVWNVKLSKDQTVVLSYTYQAPKISPRIFSLGPLTIQQSNNSTIVFSESRLWHLASDAAPALQFTGNLQLKGIQAWGNGPKLIQSKNKVGGGSPSNITFNSTPAAGNLVVVAVITYSGAPTSTSITDNQSNTYTLIGSAQHATASNDYVALYYAQNINSSGTFTVTNTITSVGSINTAIYEYSGLSKTAPLDTSNTATTGSSKSVLSGTVTPSANGSLFFAAMVVSTTQTVPPTVNNNFTLLDHQDDSATHEPWATANLIKYNASSQNVTFTLNNTGSWAVAIAVFKP